MTPFKINMELKNSDGNHRDKKKRLNHTSKQVEQSARDGLLKKATKIMLQDAENDQPRLSFEESVEKLKAKFPDRKPENDFSIGKIHCVTPFQPTLVMATLKKMSKEAATALDGWCRDLLMVACNYDNSILNDIGVILAQITTSIERDSGDSNIYNYYDKFTMDIVRAARLVGIPKPEGGVRPIVIGSFFAKYAGSCILNRAGHKTIPDQYAINTPNGAAIIGIKSREAFGEGKAIIRLDISNAFNETVRKRVVEQLEDEGFDKDLLAYVHTMYGPESNLIMLGPDMKYEIIKAVEGLRQGDSPSSYIFCIVVRKVRDYIIDTFPGSTTKCMGYMDDKTLITEPHLAHAVANAAVKILRELGFRVNVDKCSIICKTGIPAPEDGEASEIPIVTPDEDFKMLGVNITDNFEKHNAAYKERIDKFFDAIDDLQVHPEITHAILNFCGKPRLLFYCQTTPPQHSKDIVEYFDLRVKQAFAKLIDVADLTLIKPKMLHDVNGGNIPNYTEHAAAIFINCRDSVLSNSKMIEQVRLTTNSPENFTSPECSHDRKWTYYIAQSRMNTLSTPQYAIALAVRCGLVPDHIVQRTGPTIRCGCDKLITVRTELAKHTATCTKLATITFTHRHTFVKDAIQHTLARHGILCHNEPKFYNFNGVDKRPDLTVRLTNPIAIDVTVVAPKSNSIEDVGKAAAEAAKNKIEKYTEGVEKSNHKFLPFAVETTGHFHDDCFRFAHLCKNEVTFYERFKFINELFGSVSLALAKFRADIVSNVAACADFGVVVGGAKVM